MATTPVFQEFKQKIETFFSFLKTDFSFKEAGEEHDEYFYKIVFESQVCCIRFLMERHQLIIDLAPSNNQKNEIDLGHILLFKDPQLNFEYPFDENGFVESEYQRLSELLKKHCKNILMGDFSEWSQIIKLREKIAEKYK